jgi:START domain
MAAGATQSDNGWSAAAVENGVTVTFRDDARLDAREVRAVAELPHPSGRIVSVVCDFTQRVDPDVREARVLSGTVGGRYEIYLRYAPRYWVVSARDVVIDVRPESSGCAWTEVAGRMPPQSGAVRMPLLRGSWAVEPIDPSRSRVTYQIAVRPGGRIPDWMVRRGASGALPDVIARVSRCLSSSRPSADSPSVACGP